MKPTKKDRKKFDIDLEYGIIREEKVADMLTNKKVEVKSTISPQGRGTTLRIQSYVHKKGEFDYIHIIDGFNDKHFFIPHDDWFDFIGTTDMFYWDVDYGTRQKANTEFLLQEKYAIR